MKESQTLALQRAVISSSANYQAAQDRLIAKQEELIAELERLLKEARATARRYVRWVPEEER